MGTREELIAAIESINADTENIRKMPDDVQDKFEEVISAIRWGGGLIGLPFGGIFGAAAGLAAANEIADALWERRDKIHEVLSQVTEKLGEIAEGILAPVTFVDKAVVWRDISAKAAEAYNFQTLTSLRSDWSGIAADRYFDAASRQEKALNAVPALATSVAKSLENLASGILAFYSTLATDLSKLITNVSTSLAAIVGKGPAAVTEADEIVRLVGLIKDAAVDAAASILKLAQEEMIVGNELGSAVGSNIGLGYQWPPAVAPGAAYDDASVADGSNEWSINTDIRLSERTPR
ncbi:hypothetical protein JGU71_16010 [Antrihabitans sp. YC3-6]|uniref:Uncharacterized protein n=1 Tax=Antrihabitans stalagmiti TaxID=2799499 RepID=A0A934U4I4_9NOCA|nr:hypothetical protein [Antrihabitans stalagmiti]MBJ8340397.1 hypothetical protein [Antrihabitans stalagmiti]